jgi:hypothetical protein
VKAERDICAESGQTPDFVQINDNSPTAFGTAAIAHSLIRTTVLWHYLGIKSLDISGARRWIEQNTDRDNFYIDIGDEGLLGILEKFMKGRLGPVFEG